MYRNDAKGAMARREQVWFHYPSGSSIVISGLIQQITTTEKTCDGKRHYADIYFHFDDKPIFKRVSLSDIYATRAECEAANT